MLPSIQSHKYDSDAASYRIHAWQLYNLFSYTLSELVFSFELICKILTIL